MIVEGHGLRVDLRNEVGQLRDPTVGARISFLAAPLVALFDRKRHTIENDESGLARPSLA